MNTREKAAPFMHHLEIDQSYPTTDNYVFTQKEGLKRFKLKRSTNTASLQKCFIINKSLLKTALISVLTGKIVLI